MLTLKGAGQIRTSRHANGFRSCPNATGVPVCGFEGGRICHEEARRLSRELRRLWLAEGWSRHLARTTRASAR